MHLLKNQSYFKSRFIKSVGSFVYFFTIFLLMIIFLLPFFWMAVNSFKTPLEIIELPPKIIFKPTLQNYINVFETQNYIRYILNSIIIAVANIIFGLVLGLPAAYSIARYKQRKISILILMARMVPGITYLIPLFIIFRRLNLIGTYIPLILSHMLVGLPLIIWIMVPFFESIPKELEEAAILDGATVVKIFLRISLPLSVPGIVTTSILSFVFSWNNFMFSIVLATGHTKTAPVAIYNFISYAQIDWGGLMAAATVIVVPVLIFTIIAQKYIIRGLSAGAVKG
ncbi:MAG: carbohydrate ABC transporter permease [Bacteroidetes bacterium]|nr:carbohydrate ABC transporter permease [Bacteroidota bacterium]